MPYPIDFSLITVKGDRAGKHYIKAFAVENVKKGNAVYFEGAGIKNWKGEKGVDLYVALQDLESGEYGWIGERGAIFIWKEQVWNLGYGGLESLNEDGTNYVKEPVGDNLFIVWKRTQDWSFEVVIDGGWYG